MIIVTIFLVPLLVLILLGAVISVSATGIASQPDDQLDDRSITDAEKCCPPDLVLLH